MRRANAAWLLARAGGAMRRYGRGSVFAVVLALIVVVVVILASVGGPSTAYRLQFGVVAPYLPALVAGLGLTIQLTLVTILLGAVLGVLVAMARLSTIAPLRAMMVIYIEIMRGTPALVQLVWVYYALPIITGIQLPAFESVTLAFTLNLGAFFGEAFRSGIQAVPREQVETAEVLGLSYFQRMRYVVVPQAFTIELPVLISLAISQFKDTSLVSTLGVADLMYNGLLVGTTTYRPLEVLTTVAAFYFLVAFPIALLARRFEIYLGRSLAQTK